MIANKVRLGLEAYSQGRTGKPCERRDHREADSESRDAGRVEIRYLSFRLNAGLSKKTIRFFAIISTSSILDDVCCWLKAKSERANMLVRQKLTRGNYFARRRLVIEIIKN